MVDAMARRYATLRDEAVSLLPMALSVLGRLREHGVKLGLLTNGSTDKQWAKIRQFDLARFFDHIQVEGDVGFGKPDLRAFRRALAALDVAPEEAWMVGDNLVWDIRGAHLRHLDQCPREWSRCRGRRHAGWSRRIPGGTPPVGEAVAGWVDQRELGCRGSLR